MRPITTLSKNPLLLLLAMECCLIYGCRAPSLQSYWLSPSLRKESGPDWWSTPIYKAEKLNGNISLVNDSSALYIRMNSRQTSLMRRFHAAGLTVWLSNPDDPKQKLGIHYPVGMHDRAEPREHHYLPNSTMPPSTTFDMLSQPNDDIEIVSDDTTMSGHKSLMEAGKFGIFPSLAEDQNSVEYVLEIELDHSLPWLTLGSRTIVEVESPAMEFKRPSEGRMERSDGHRGGGRGSWGGSMRPSGGYGRHERPDFTEGIRPNTAIHFKYIIQLAKGPTDSKATESLP